MRIIRGVESFPRDAGAASVALGVFDGVHLAHQAILEVAVGLARGGGMEALVCTFDPHPLSVLQPGRGPALISTLEERLALLAARGVDATVVLRFTEELAAIEPEAFVKDVVMERLRARDVVVGYNHTFGRGARGDAALLASLGDRLGFRAHVVPPLMVEGVPVSSTEIRSRLRAGDVERAARYLGRPYAIAGEIVAGAGRGRTLGFPTANVKPDRELLVPTGVYACRALVDGHGAGAVVNVGVRPTFGEREVVVEAHLLDFCASLYGRRLRLEFVGRIREERKFPGPEALRRQIADDVAEARRRL